MLDVAIIFSPSLENPKNGPTLVQEEYDDAAWCLRDKLLFIYYDCVLLLLLFIHDYGMILLLTYYNIYIYYIRFVIPTEVHENTRNTRLYNI